jgi:hypothetical protein
MARARRLARVRLLVAAGTVWSLLGLTGAPLASAMAPMRVVLEGTPTADDFLGCAFPTTVARTGTLIIRSDGVVIASDFHEVFANPSTGASVALTSAGTEGFSESETGLVVIESHGLYAQIVVAGEGIIHLDAGNIVFTFDPATGAFEEAASRGTTSDFPFDELCELLAE